MSCNSSFRAVAVLCGARARAALVIGGVIWGGSCASACSGDAKTGPRGDAGTQASATGGADSSIAQGEGGAAAQPASSSTGGGQNTGSVGAGGSDGGPRISDASTELVPDGAPADAGQTELPPDSSGVDAAADAAVGDPEFPFTWTVEDAGPAALYFFPPDLPNVPLEQVDGVLTLVASTLREGPDGYQLLAAVRNEGEIPLCSAAISVDLFDLEGSMIGNVSGGVHSGRIFQFPEAQTTVHCVPPGQMGMAVSTPLPLDVAPEDLGYIGHRFPAFALDTVVELPSASLSEIQAVDTDAGTRTYTGTLTNNSDGLVTELSVLIFPVNDVGRPLDVAIGRATLALAPGDSWQFETTALPADDLTADVVGIAEVTLSVE